MNPNPNDSKGDDKIVYRIFNILAKRASGVDDPRINDRHFSKRVSVDWSLIEPLFEPIEKYCHDRKRRTLSALVVFSDGPT